MRSQLESQTKNKTMLEMVRGCNLTGGNVLGTDLFGDVDKRSTDFLLTLGSFPGAHHLTTLFTRCLTGLFLLVGTDMATGKDVPKGKSNTC